MQIDRVFYINLDHRTDRRKEIEEELEKMDIIAHDKPNPDNKITYERFSAIKHDTIGGVGCGKSHIGVLKLAKERGYSTIIILEDDFMFTVSKDVFYKELKNLQGVYMDVCLLSGNIMNYTTSNYNPNLYRLFKAQTTSGYLIQCRYNDVLIDCFEKAVFDFERTNQHWLYAIDVAWNKLQSVDPWYVLKNKVGKQRPSHSDCSNTFCNVEW